MNSLLLLGPNNNFADTFDRFSFGVAVYSAVPNLESCPQSFYRFYVWWISRSVQHCQIFLGKETFDDLGVEAANQILFKQLVIIFPMEWRIAGSKAVKQPQKHHLGCLLHVAGRKSSSGERQTSKLQNVVSSEDMYHFSLLLRSPVIMFICKRHLWFLQKATTWKCLHSPPLDAVPFDITAADFSDRGVIPGLTVFFSPRAFYLMYLRILCLHAAWQSLTTRFAYFTLLFVFSLRAITFALLRAWYS